MNDIHIKETSNNDRAVILKIKEIQQWSNLGQIWDNLIPLMVKVLQLLDEVEVLQEDGAMRAGRHRVLVVGDRDARGRGQLLRCCPRKQK